MTEGTKVPDRVPRFQHKCPRVVDGVQHGWETCATAASLIDPYDAEAEHGCSKSVTPPFVFKGEVRET